jgi:hypothetical protein
MISFIGIKTLQGLQSSLAVGRPFKGYLEILERNGAIGFPIVQHNQVTKPDQCTPEE